MLMWFNNHISFIFKILFNRNRTTFAATRYVLWVLNKYTKNAFTQRPGHRRSLLYDV